MRVIIVNLATQILYILSWFSWYLYLLTNTSTKYSV